MGSGGEVYDEMVVMRREEELSARLRKERERKRELKEYLDTAVRSAEKEKEEEKVVEQKIKEDTSEKLKAKFGLGKEAERKTIVESTLI